MTDFSLDHVLIAVSDVDKAGRTYSDELGFTATPAGSHPHRGTRNRLIAFESEYLELIAVDDIQPATRHKPDLVSFLARREGLFMFALGTENIDYAVGSLRRRGVNVNDPTVGSRRDSSGQAGYTWRSAEIDPGILPGSATFLIQHDQTISERYRKPANSTQHSNGARSVARLTLAVRDSQAAAMRWHRLIGAPIETESKIKHVLGDVGHATVRLRNCKLEFVSPQGPGPAGDIMGAYGECPVMISVVVGDLQQAVTVLESRQKSMLNINSEDGARSCLLSPEVTHGLFLLLVEQP